MLAVNGGSRAFRFVSMKALERVGNYLKTKLCTIIAAVFFLPHRTVSSTIPPPFISSTSTVAFTWFFTKLYPSESCLEKGGRDAVANRMDRPLFG